MLISKNENFMEWAEAKSQFSDSGISLTDENITKLCEWRILTLFFTKSVNPQKTYNQYVLNNDVNAIISFFKKYKFTKFESLLNKYFNSFKQISTDEYPLIKNILMAQRSSADDLETIIKNHLLSFNARKEIILRSGKTQFARSAHYMGSKVNLRSFILEGLREFELSQFYFVDLMTGSGTMAGTFSDFGKTISSDAMQFPGYLSIVQGGGYSKKRAINLLIEIKKAYSNHYMEINKIYDKLMKMEDRFLKLDDTQEMMSNYYEYLQSSPLYSISDFDIDEKVKQRKTSHKKFPYILFTEYFANVYFGVNQSVQIDSLRYAIDNIIDQLDKSWALGALIVTCSKIASSHAAHFAQPVVIKDKSGIIKSKNIKNILLKRRMSAWREYEAILLSLAEESENGNNNVSFIEGPWQNAIQSIESVMTSENVIVYIDAPYTREEYSRYYHVLETLVKYDYPEVCGKGKLPSKKTGERFSSEFFTKTSKKIEDVFINMFVEILAKGWICAWSYSDHGMVSIIEVVNRVCKEINCSIMTYSTPYSHKSQNQAVKAKKVEEYLVLFIPRH
jgi:adenine-specific DNA methylase